MGYDTLSGSLKMSAFHGLAALKYGGVKEDQDTPAFLLIPCLTWSLLALAFLTFLFRGLGLYPTRRERSGEGRCVQSLCLQGSNQLGVWKLLCILMVFFIFRK